MQEVALRSRAQVLCGDDSIDFDVVSACATSIFVLDLISYIDAS
jgi:3-deoxy-D-manno-octulosonate 8-phosphate phosphatase KdsC-like HAD superfamily phosphatase